MLIFNVNFQLRNTKLIVQHTFKEFVMSDQDDVICLQARWVLPMQGEPIENGCVLIAGNRIVEVCSAADLQARSSGCARVIDYGQSVITPGLMNLHTHLDYSALKHFDNYSDFFTWIRGLIGNSWQWSQEEWMASANAGAREVIESATATLADASYSGAAAKAIAKSGLRGVVGLEIFGIDESKVEQAFEIWLEKYESFMRDCQNVPEIVQALKDERLKITIAPHTPYSVCPSLLRKALAWCKERSLPMLIHIAESEAECRWIASDDAQLDEFLKQAFRSELPDLPWRGHGLSPVKHLESHGLLDECMLAAHVVQMSQEDIDLIAKHGLSAVHCPRSNSRLRNGVAPFPRLLAAGIEMALGTDSAASTDDLNVLAEARFAWDLHRAVDKKFVETSEKALYFLTLGAARALKMADKLGSLEAGKYADISVFSISHLPAMAQARPFECLIYGGAVPRDLVVNGVWLMQGGYIAGKSPSE